MRDWNCAVTTMLVLGEVFDVAPGDQVVAAAVGMQRVQSSALVACIAV
jgi:hypothetical protein